MRKTMLLLLLSTAAGHACGPFFPPSYLADQHYGDNYALEAGINVPAELELIAREYQLIDTTRFADSDKKAATTDLAEFSTQAAELNRPDLIPVYTAFADAVRNNQPAEPPAGIPAELQEFVLYMEGVRAIKQNPDDLNPVAWQQLLELDQPLRIHRTVWVHYMLGNMASSHGAPKRAATHYAACRQAAKSGLKDGVGLAHATFKSEQIAQNDPLLQIQSGVKAVGYYHYTGDPKRLKYCMDTLKAAILLAKNTSDLLKDPIALEALFIIRNRHLPADFFTGLDPLPQLKSGSRLAWFLYQRGQIEQAQALLKQQPEADVLANWLRFNMQLRSGKSGEATAHLTRWLHELGKSDRILYQFSREYPVTPDKAVHGQLGCLLVTGNQLLKALVHFVQADSYGDAALIAERYLPTESLQTYVETFDHDPVDHPCNYIYKNRSDRIFLEDQMSYLLARRLFRQGKITTALKYYPPAIRDVAETYLAARAKSDDRTLGRNTRSAHLFHAARILRWQGLELAGTELAPDYRICGGGYSYYSMKEALALNPEMPEMYRQTRPAPDLRYHYRHKAAELAGQAAALSWNRHQRATQLWAAGEWLRLRYPNEADLYYKQLARINFQPLAKAADQKRWFPPATPELENVCKGTAYLSPKTLAESARNYSPAKPQ